MRHLTKSPVSLKARLLVAQFAVFVAALLAFAGAYSVFEQGDMRYHVIDVAYGLTQQLGRSIVKSPDGIVQFHMPISLAHEIERYPHAQYGAINEATGVAVVGPRKQQCRPNCRKNRMSPRDGFVMSDRTMCRAMARSIG